MITILFGAVKRRGPFPEDPTSSATPKTSAGFMVALSRQHPATARTRPPVGPEDQVPNVLTGGGIGIVLPSIDRVWELE
jgi:hypothetical protein